MEYKEITFYLGCTIEEAMQDLYDFKQKYNCKVCGKFNDKILYSDIDSIESAYIKITGLTLSECKKRDKERKLKYEQHKKEHEERIPELTKYWIEEGKKLLTEDKWEYWEKCVPVRLSDLYEGMELKCCLDIIKILKESNNDFKKAKIEIENQRHSGMSFGLVCSMINSFYDKGRDFVEFARK